jgi:nucleoid DNA-binding protein
MKRYSKTDLVNDLSLFHVFADVPKAQVTAFVNDFLQLLKTKVKEDTVVALSGFGKFEKYAYTKDGKPTGKFKPKFTAYGEFKDLVNA